MQRLKNGINIFLFLFAIMVIQTLAVGIDFP